MPDFEINIPFQGWPVPGHQNPKPRVGDDSLQRPPPRGKPGLVCYAYDPLFDKPLHFRRDSFNHTFTGKSDQHKLAYHLGQGYQFIITDDVKNKDYWLKEIAGSARPGRLLKGKEYWEVKVLSVPTDVPPDWQNPLDDTDFHTTYRPPFTGPLGPGKTGTTMWSKKLNTFLNPVIGLWPACNTFGKTNVIGLDDPKATYRSIGVTRTSTQELFHNRPEWPVEKGRAAQFVPASDVRREPEPIQVNGVVPPDPFYNVTGQISPVSLDGTIQTFRVVVANLRASEPFGDYSMISVAASPDFEGSRHFNTPFLFGDLFYADDVKTEFFTNPPDKQDMAHVKDTGVTIPFGSGPGRHGPVFKGRADMLKTIKTPGDDPGPPVAAEEGPYDNGIWTGVDVGEWGAGDTIMIATDTISRKVWFGKNGVWKGPGGSGPGGSADPGTGDGYACFMDGPEGMRNYYPGVSFRLGPTTLKMVFTSQNFEYPPPLGFIPYRARFA